MPEDISFAGRVAIVTGAGNGLGKEYALDIARRGGKVVVNDLGGSGAGVGASSSAADAVVAQIIAEGGEAVASHHSVATREGGEGIVATAMAAFGRVDICVCNAGFLRNNRFSDMTDVQFDAMIDVHLKGAFYVAQAAFREMRANGYGRFIFTGSASCLFGQPWQANYAAAKGGLVGLTHVIALEGEAHGIKANMVLPVAQTRLAEEIDEGPLEVESHANAIRSADYSGVNGRLTADFVKPLVVYLASEECAVTHSIYSASGGRYARVFIDVSEGWVSPPGNVPCRAEDIAANLATIEGRERLHQFRSVYSEFTAVSEATRRQYPG